MLAYPYVHLTRDASKPTRNGYVHPMIPVLLTVTISCTEFNELIERVKSSLDVPQVTKDELILTIKQSSGGGCWDAKAD